MGSKRWMLRNGLGHLLHHEISKANRFIDLFSGSGAVAQFVATSDHPIQVIAFDLQLFCVTLAHSVIGRSTTIDGEAIWNTWYIRATDQLKKWGRLNLANGRTPPLRPGFTQAYVKQIRTQCADDTFGTLTSAYGGYYFSQGQALWFDALQATLPEKQPARSVALAALIQAASSCAASPGHTAQPFSPTLGAKEFLHDAWQRSVCEKTKNALIQISALHAKQAGRAEVRNANDATSSLQKGDLVFLDPPYSGVHYSRFYHVLETIARGRCGEVSGSGRYPPPAERPRSSYSVSTEATQALDDLLKKIAEKEAKAILTFPQRVCSNGLSGKLVNEIAAKYFKVQSTFKRSRFSTLGGTINTEGEGYGRAARQKTHEMIFTLNPR